MELRHYDHIHTNAHGMEQGGLGLHLYELGTGNWNLGIGHLGLDTEDWELGTWDTGILDIQTTIQGHCRL
jgi:hypothetical protein